MRKILFALALVIVLIPVVNTEATEGNPSMSHLVVQNEINHFAKSMAQQYQFDEQSIVQQLSSRRYNQAIIDKITNPAESMPWHRYRQIWMTDKRINAGIAFWQKHEQALSRAEEVFGVDRAVIVAIIGIETFFGRFQGSYPVIEALHTLGFCYPKRALFFRSELAQFYLLAREQNWRLDDIKGSYAGAMGMGQFISSSYRAYGIDFNNDRKVNLFTDPVDMIGSVANYFKRHHWRPKGFVARLINLNGQQQQLVQTQLKLKYVLKDLQGKGIEVSALKDKTEFAGIFAFEQAESKQSYRLVGDNFYVITRYNHSPMYALAVYQLSEAIKLQREKQLIKKLAIPG